MDLGKRVRKVEGQRWRISCTALKVVFGCLSSTLKSVFGCERGWSTRSGCDSKGKRPLRWRWGLLWSRLVAEKKLADFMAAQTEGRMGPSSREQHGGFKHRLELLVPASKW